MHPAVAPPARARAPHAGDGILLALALFALYAALLQGTFYKVDGHALLDLSRQGIARHPYHTFYLGLLAWLRAATQPLGLGLYDTACILSALGTAAGVCLVHTASRVLGGDRAQCTATALAFGLSPGVVFFATVVEVHGVFLVFAGLSACALAWCARSLHAVAAVVAGLSLALAYLAHPSGALMGALLPVLAWAARQHALPWRKVLAVCAGAAASAVFAILLLIPLLRRWAGIPFDPTATAGGWLSFGAGKLLDPLLTLRTLALEWVLPAAPLSLLALLGLGLPRTRTGSLLLVAGVLPYALAAQLMLAGYTERGAYLLPAAWPTALVAVALAGQRPRVLALLCALAGALAVAQVIAHDEPERARGFAAGVAEIAAGAPVFLITGDEHDYGAHAMYLPATPQSFLTLAVSQSAETMRQGLPAFDADLARRMAEGTVVLLTQAARRQLEAAAASGSWMMSHDPPLQMQAPGAAALLQHLLATYHLQPVRAVGFAGYRLERR
jgi:hypothetical protein